MGIEFEAQRRWRGGANRSNSGGGRAPRARPHARAWRPHRMCCLRAAPTAHVIESLRPGSTKNVAQRAQRCGAPFPIMLYVLFGSTCCIALRELLEVTVSS